MRILAVLGTRPEVIKMAPVIAALRQRPELECSVCVTGQHREMLQQALKQFKITPDFDLAVMQPGQTLHGVTQAVLNGVAAVIEDFKPDHVLVHGDTTTAMAGALAAFYAQVSVGHVEAGLRSFDMAQPWPEEFNRRVVDMVSERLYAPTTCAKENLLREGQPADHIRVTGNTVIDALDYALSTIDHQPELSTSLQNQFSFLNPAKRLVLVTGHRRENHNRGLSNICMALRDLAMRPDVEILYPVHPNPRVESTVGSLLGAVPNVFLLPPLDYFPFVWLMRRAHLILTDSGGIQEEAPHLGKPVLVLREVTERPEAVAAGTVLLVGTGRKRIYAETTRLLDNALAYHAATRCKNPYGDGTAAIQIAADLAALATARRSRRKPAQTRPQPLMTTVREILNVLQTPVQTRTM